MRHILATLLILGTIATTAQADTYKCPNGKGGMTFQDMPCAGEGTQLLLPTGPTTGYVPPAVPTGAPVAATVSVQREAAPVTPKDCLKIGTFDTSILKHVGTYHEVSWKADINNTCAQPFAIWVIFSFYDRDDFLLQLGREQVLVPGNGQGKARGTVMIETAKYLRTTKHQVVWRAY